MLNVKCQRNFFNAVNLSLHGHELSLFFDAAWKHIPALHRGKSDVMIVKFLLGDVMRKITVVPDGAREVDDI